MRAMNLKAVGSYVLSMVAIMMLSITAIVLYGTVLDRPEIESSAMVLVMNAAGDFEMATANEFEMGPEDYSGFTDDLPGMNDDLVLEEALKVIMGVENPGMDPEAVGDKHLRNKAYGLFQIRKPYLDDVNRIVGPKRMMEKWGVKVLSLYDMKDYQKARWVVVEYLSYYGALYEKRTGQELDKFVYGRIHNGGPSGWRKSSTNAYVAKMERVISSTN